jgi:hypothetical protein
MRIARIASLAAVVAAAFASPSSLAGDSSPVQGDPLAALLTPPGGMALSFPGDNTLEVLTRRIDAADAGSPERAVLSLEVRLAERPAKAVRAVCHAQNTQGWFYQTSKMWLIPWDGWLRLEIDFSPTSSIWEASGHARPWDSLSASGLTRFGLRLFCEGECSAALYVRDAKWVAAGTGYEGSGGDAVICDLVEPAAGIHEGGLWELAFRTMRPVRDPFDPGEADFRCVVTTPSGRDESVVCFLDQEYALSNWGPRPVGAPRWMARYRPREVGEHRYRLELSFATRHVGEAATGTFIVRSAPAAPALPGDSADRVDPVPHVLSLDPKDHDGWRPRLEPHPAAWNGEAFRRQSTSSPVRVWRPVIEWTARWGRWQGAGAYDLAIAWEFDRVLDDAAARGESMPLAVVDDGPLLEHGMYRWPRNPLCAGEGGPLAAPGEFFRDERAIRYFLRRFRYLVARYGHSPAVSSWCLATGLPVPGVADWHRRIGSAASDLGVGENDRQPLLSLHPFAVPWPRQVSLGDFEKDKPAGWRADRLDAEGVRLSRRTDGGDGDALAVGFPPAGYEAASGHATIYRDLDRDLSKFDYLMFDVRMPEGARGVGRAQAIFRDRDLLWYEHLVPTPLRAGDWTRCVVDLRSPGHTFVPVGHKRAWTTFTRARIRAVSIRVFPNGQAGGEALVDRVRLCAGPVGEAGGLQVSVGDRGAAKVEAYDKYEMVLALNREFSNPFDPEQIAIDVVFRPEGGGEAISVPGFYYEPYTRSRQKKTVGGKYATTRPRDVEVVDVAGESDSRVRFAPTVPGGYSTTIRARTPDGEVERAGPTFTCVKSDRKGYVRVSQDGRYFEHTTGEFFYPAGPVIRSPNDLRDIGRDRKIREQVLNSGFLGTYQFDEYFDALMKNGCTWIAMWSCSWWCGLEWYHEWPGYSGTGVYNMANAWRLDHVIEDARNKGIYIQLCIQNHGQTSDEVDREWEFHPYNKYMPDAFVPIANGGRRKQLRPDADTKFLRPGGWIARPQDFYSDPKAMKQRKKLFRYYVARWGYSTSIMGWLMSSEIDFTAAYWRRQYHSDDSDFRAGRWPEHSRAYQAGAVLGWFDEITRYMRRIDPVGRMMSLHSAQPHRGRKLRALEGFSYAQSNAYSAFGARHLPLFKGPIDEMGRVPVPMAMEQYYSVYMSIYDRPVIVGEWGGQWIRNPLPLLDAELHAGTWASVMTPMAGATGFWWWSHVHFNDRYDVYAAALRFMKGEDRRDRGMKLAQSFIQPLDPKIGALVLANDDRADVYVYHYDHVRALGSAPTIEDLTLTIPSLERGTWRVEFWDTAEGKRVRTESVESKDGQLSVPIGTLKGDVAIKIRRAK